MASVYESDSRPPYMSSYAVEEAWGQTSSRQKTSFSSRKKEYSLLTKCVAEFIGDLTFVYVGTMQAHASPDSILHAAFAHGFTIFILVTAFGHISGGHFNPAVSWAIAGAGKMPIWHLPFYVASQLLGGFCGALLTASILTQTQLSDCGAGATLLTEGSQWWQGLIAETIVTFFLVHTILISAVDTDTVTLAPLAIGLTLSIDILSTGSITGASMNPARSLGPSIVGSIFATQPASFYWNYHYIYWAGPLLGSTIALCIYKLFESREERIVA
uniref:Aquaporin n=1 Tax=Caenorhabditis tropicalis TaxID=1561998 RepID=A0A1I7UN58_9PELO